MTNVNNKHNEQELNHNKLLSRRKFLQRAMAITGFTGIGLLLESNGLLEVSAQGPGGGGQPPAGGGAGGPGGMGGETLEDFVGVTTDGNVVSGLYSIEPTNISTEPIRVAAEDFIATLTTEQQEAVLFAIDDDEWRMWSNVDGYSRQGLDLEDMTDEQKEAAYNLLSVALSAKGYDLTRDIMRLNTTEGEIMDSLARFNEYLYYFTIMGEPSDTEPWGFQLDGHHLVINYFILGDQVVMAPVFMGAEPPIAPSGEYEGLAVLQEEQDKGLALIQALDADQQAVAILSSSKTGIDLIAGAFSDNSVIAYEGIAGAALTDAQKELLLDLINQFVSNMRDGHAEVKMEEVESHIDETYFAWIGSTEDDAVFYYRIQSPVILIEFDHQPPGPLGMAIGSAEVPSRDHIHYMVRTPNGNDYGKSLLQQHLANVKHVNGQHVLSNDKSTLALGAMGLAGAAALLPPRYQGDVEVSSKPMGAADLVYDENGQVAWDHIWTDFCDLALAGGPPHRGTLLEPVSPEAVNADPEAYQAVMAEIARGLRMVTNLEVVTDAAPGWIGLVCTDENMALWLLRAILVENISVRREGQTLFFPVGPEFTLKQEIKNIVTAVAKTNHYWQEHIYS